MFERQEWMAFSSAVETEDELRMRCIVMESWMI